MQDIYFYSQALTERYHIYLTQQNIIMLCPSREVTEIVTGSFPSVHLRTDCRCPPSHPVINTVNSDRCIQHTGMPPVTYYCLLFPHLYHHVYSHFIYYY